MAKVLVVGSRDLSPDLGRTILWSDGIERIIADSPAAALEVAQAFVPSLVVVEAESAAGDGGLVRRLRESAGTRRASIVVLVRDSGPGSEDFVKAGANLILKTPVDPEEWNGQIESLLGIPRRVRIRYAVEFARSGNGEPSSGRIKATGLDISVHGMLLVTSLPLHRGAVLELDVKLHASEPGFRATGVVVRAHGRDPVHAGIRFVNIPGDAVHQIRNLLSSVGPDRGFGRYEVQGLVGEGAMGRVYRAFDPLARRVVAIKTLKSEYLSSDDAVSYIERFRREAQAAANLVHPNIVSILDVGPDYFVMELLEGATIQALLRERGSLSPADVCKMLRPVAEALDFAHSRGTIHRDVKPANLMVLLDGRPKVMDFGVAHLTSGAITGEGQFFGSPAYMAPEQITQGVVSALTDVYAFAVVAYELLTGKKPLDADTVPPLLYKVVNTKPEPPSITTPGLPPRYDDLFRRALSKEPFERPPTAAAFVDELEFEAPSLQQDAPLVMPARIPDAITPTDTSETVDLRNPALVRWGFGVMAAFGSLMFVLLVAQAHPAKWIRPAPGLSVTADPVGATVLVDGKPVGKTPMVVRGIAPGPHTVRVEGEGRSPSELRIEFPREGPPTPLHVALQTLNVALALESDPSPVLVRVDGAYVGNTPLSGATAPGTHELRMERQGFETWRETITLQAGETLRRFARLRSLGLQANSHRWGWVHRGDMVEVGPGVTPPQRLSGDAPANPPHLGGTVVADIIVTEDGGVIEPAIVESAGDVLDRAFLEAVRHWRYQPAETNGVQVRVRFRERYTFEPTR